MKKMLYPTHYLNIITEQQEVAQTKTIMKHILFLIIAFLTTVNSFTQNTKISDSLYFTFNKVYLKKIDKNDDYGYKKDRLYFISEPEIQANFHFQIEKICNKYIKINNIDVLDIKDFLSENEILINEQSLFIRIHKFLRLTKNKKIFFVKKKEKRIYSAKAIWEEI